MKIRLGFVSNSSSASFYCEVCGNSYEVETRCGGPTTEEEWMEEVGIPMPTEGICEGCFGDWDGDEGYMMCDRCLTPHLKTDMIKISDGMDYPMKEHLMHQTDRRCINCLAKEGDIDTIAIEADIPADKLATLITHSKPYYDMLEKMNDPAYELTDTEKKLVKLITQQPEKTTPSAPKALSMTAAQIQHMSPASKRLFFKIAQKTLGQGIRLESLLANSAEFMSANGVGHIEFDENTAVREVLDQIKAAAGLDEDISKIYSILNEDI